MKSTGFGFVAWISAALTVMTIVGVLGDPLAGFMLMFLLGAFHVVTAIVMLFFNKRLEQPLRRLFFAYCTGVVTYFAIGLVVLLVDGDPGDAGAIASATFALLLGVSFSTLKFAILTTNRAVKHRIMEKSILDA
jgi:hypothetical protein